MRKNFPRVALFICEGKNAGREFPLDLEVTAVFVKKRAKDSIPDFRLAKTWIGFKPAVLVIPNDSVDSVFVDDEIIHKDIGVVFLGTSLLRFGDITAAIVETMENNNANYK